MWLMQDSCFCHSFTQYQSSQNAQTLGQFFDPLYVQDSGTGMADLQDRLPSFWASKLLWWTLELSGHDILLLLFWVFGIDLCLQFINLVMCKLTVSNCPPWLWLQLCNFGISIHIFRNWHGLLGVGVVHYGDDRVRQRGHFHTIWVILRCGLDQEHSHCPESTSICSLSWPVLHVMSSKMLLTGNPKSSVGYKDGKWAETSLGAKFLLVKMSGL